MAIRGDNGAANTTLLNVLGERLKVTGGELLKGHAVETGYFGQHQLEELMLEDTLLDNLRARAHGVSLEEVRGWLGAFGFSGNDEINKKARVLSGGEKARLALLRILVTRINLCLLDEPTNHLDIETKELLKNAIRDFEGTTIFVSHDREFVSDIAERILYLSHDHELIDHLGNLESFFAKYPQYVRHLEGKARASSAPPSATAATETKKGPTLSYEERKKYKNQIRSLEKKIASLETEIEQLGREKDALHSETTGAAFSAISAEAQTQMFDKLSAAEGLLHLRMVEWEKLSSELEQIRKIVPDIV